MVQVAFRFWEQLKSILISLNIVNLIGSVGKK